MTMALNPTQTRVPTPEAGSLECPGQTNRFTLDGSKELENQLAWVCEKVVAGVLKIIPPHKLDALVLGGGYGRGEGGVLRTQYGDRPYNDLEFYVFLRGPRLWSERKFNSGLHELGEQLSPEAGLHVEFKVDSLAHLRRSPVTMFSYDLVSAHRVLWGNPAPFTGCQNHLNAGKIPLSEATRLLMNRCSGLLFAREKLTREPLSADDADFIGRNIAKAQLAFGDVVLTAFGEYHWSCRERHKRILTFSSPESLPWLEEARRLHATGVDFKLHPFQTRTPVELLRSELEATVAFALEVWLWLESRRLGRKFTSTRDYVLSSINKCPGTSPWRNLLLNVKIFGAAVFLQASPHRHPRESIFNALALLMWETRLSEFDLQSQLIIRNYALWDDDLNNRITIYEAVWSHIN